MGQSLAGDLGTQLLPEIAGYRVVSRLGRGGMGEVFEAVNARGHTVALKVIRRDRVSKTTIERFGREADAMFDLHHTNIAHFFTYDVIPDGTPFFTMKYVDGGTLADRIDDYKSNPRDAVALMIKVADAVQFLHSKGFVHRDLKPHNILLDRAGEPYVSDFGLVKDLDDLLNVDDQVEANSPQADTERHLSVAETVLKVVAENRVPLTLGVIGTLPYASPEQLRNDKMLVGPATDIWALGVILYELFCGTRPFDSEDPLVLSSLIRTHQPHPPASFIPPVPAAIERIILKCLVKQPQGRYPSAARLSVDLKAWLTARPGSRQVSITARRGFLAAAIPCAVLGAGVFFVGRRERPQSSPNALERLENDLANKGRVELIVNGWPRWSEVVAGTTDDLTVREEDGWYFAVNTGGERDNVLELARNLTPPYRFCVVLRHQGPGSVGLYACRSKEQATDEAYHLFVTINIRDNGIFAPGKPQNGMFALGVNCIPADSQSGLLSPPQLRQLAVARPQDGWRRVDMEITAQNVRGLVDGKQIANPSRASLLKSVSQLTVAHPEMNGLTPNFPTNGGLGIYAILGDIAVKSAWIEKI